MRPHTVPPEVEFSSGPAVATKFEAFTRLSPEDRAALADITQNVRYVEARRDLVAEGDKPRHVYLVLDGWGARYKSLPDGTRQILNFLLPGDFCGVSAYLLREMDHSIGAITKLKVATITPDEMQGLRQGRPRIAEALRWEELVSESIQREWTLNVGLRIAYQRLGHLLVEIYLRLQVVGRASDGRCDFPLTQNDLADATSLTSVHVNRTLQELRRDGLIELERRQLHILDLERLMHASMFNPNYLHFDHAGQHLDAGNHA
jgi:CRP-like cAMP-binding protein